MRELRLKVTQLSASAGISVHVSLNTKTHAHSTTLYIKERKMKVRDNIIKINRFKAITEVLIILILV